MQKSKKNYNNLKAHAYSDTLAEDNPTSMAIKAANKKQALLEIFKSYLLFLLSHFFIASFIFLVFLVVLL